MSVYGSYICSEDYLFLVKMMFLDILYLYQETRYFVQKKLVYALLKRSSKSPRSFHILAFHYKLCVLKVVWIHEAVEQFEKDVDTISTTRINLTHQQVRRICSLLATQGTCDDLLNPEHSHVWLALPLNILIL